MLNFIWKIWFFIFDILNSIEDKKEAQEWEQTILCLEQKKRNQKESSQQNLKGKINKMPKDPRLKKARSFRLQ